VLGTSLLDEHKRYLTQFSTAIIALDPDALMKSIEFARELQSYVDDVRVVKLTDDLKYRNPEDFDKLTNVGE
jgi:LDH2 family malate/lactate/ureidoglycolate dehydrogenase